MEGLSIGKIARAANVSADTVRYYERVGLLSAPPRAKSGYRAYSEADVRRLILIRRARDIGFSIEEIGELIGLQPGTDAGHVQRVIQKRLDDIDQKLAHLRHWRVALFELQGLDTNACPLASFLLRRLEEFHRSHVPAGTGE
jgi:DNA-binding transcriptional MerR regulator